MLHSVEAVRPVRETLRLVNYSMLYSVYFGQQTIVILHSVDTFASKQHNVILYGLTNNSMLYSMDI